MADRPPVALIAAMAKGRVIGRDNRLPWRLPADLAHFKRLTMGKPMLMGRRTWESLPGLLPGRRHIVLTRDPGYRVEGGELAGSLGQGIELACASNPAEIMVVGGAAIYRAALPLAERMYLTLIDAEIQGDALFPDWDGSRWQEIERERRAGDERNPFAMTFVTLARRPAD